MTAPRVGPEVTPTEDQRERVLLAACIEMAKQDAAAASLCVAMSTHADQRRNRDLWIIRERIVQCLTAALSASSSATGCNDAEYKRGFDDGWDTFLGAMPSDAEGHFATLDEWIREGEPCDHEAGHCSCALRQAWIALQTLYRLKHPSSATGEREQVSEWEVHDRAGCRTIYTNERDARGAWATMTQSPAWQANSPLTLWGRVALDRYPAPDAGGSA